MNEELKLSKKERRELKKLQKQTELKRRERVGTLKKLLIWLVVLGVVVGGGYKLIKSVMAEKPGQAVTDLGRGHVAVGTSVQYNSNPPTSGPHYGQWTKRGVYDEPIEDGYLIHSLEHGYVIVSYRCEGSCEGLKTSLKNFYGQNKKKKLIVVLRPSLETKIALTAWKRILKLDEWDESQAEAFVRAFENRGPEKTME